MEVNDSQVKMLQKKVDNRTKFRVVIGQIEVWKDLNKIRLEQWEFLVMGNRSPFRIGAWPLEIQSHRKVKTLLASQIFSSQMNKLNCLKKRLHQFLSVQSPNKSRITTLKAFLRRKELVEEPTFETLLELLTRDRLLAMTTNESSNTFISN
jgi:hypothetical protein